MTTKLRPSSLSRFLSALLLGCIAATSGCRSKPSSDLPPGFTAPNSQILAAVRRFADQNSNAHYRMSARSGTLLWLDNGGAPLSLDSSTSVTAIADLNTRFPGLLQLRDPIQELQNIGPQNQLGHSQGADPRETSLTTIRFTQIYESVPLSARGLTAFYNEAGLLVAIQANVTPTERLNVVTGPVAATNADLREFAKSRHRQGRRYHFYDVNPDTGDHSLYLREEFLEESGFLRRQTLDPISHEVLTTILEMPSDIGPAQADWATGGQTLSTTARDLLGTNQSILSFRLANMGLAMAFDLPGIFAPTNYLTIGDATLQPAVMPQVPFATNEQNWGDEPDFESLRDATGLAKNMETTLDWFASQQNWKSWDNGGTKFRTAIHSNFNSDSSVPQLNAFGGGGMIYVCDGKTDTGQTFGDSLDIIAHEFTHSVITATADFQYYHEPGALNEALADFFGAAVGNFENTTIGEDVGYILRDLLNPAEYNQPKKYSDYASYPIDFDNGGVHTNSGIINRALALTVLGNGSRHPGQGTARTSKLIMNALKHVAYNSEARLEDYAASTLGFCKLQSPGIYSAALCDQLEYGFLETELLNATL